MRPVMDQCGSEGGEVKRVEFSFDYTGPSSYLRGLGKGYGTSILLGPMSQRACWVPLAEALLAFADTFLRSNVGNCQQTGFAKRCQMTRDRVAGASLRTVIMSSE